MKKLLMHLAEECGELTQECMKVLRGRKRHRELTLEAADVVAKIDALIHMGHIDSVAFNKQYRTKFKEYVNG
jgi:NTP pyrophosphatase (non-canonical NTP hydrolase)